MENKVLEFENNAPAVPARALTPPLEMVTAAAAPSVCTKFLRVIFMGNLLVKLKRDDCILVRKISQDKSSAI
ncbi:MAG: hypothetical protein DMF63_05690 [Acidobacteria bacterium]|nr:MAG: hypothetical protein DMF63_05690 [Acidobacteriota bacterium]